MDEKFNKEEIWGKCLSYIKDRIQETAFQTWFDGVQVSSINKEDITLLVPNKFHYEWLESKYRTLIDESIKSIVTYPLIVNYTVPVTSKSSNEIPSFIEKKDAPTLPRQYKKNNVLNSRYTFDTFIEGKDNQFAKAAAFSVSETPGQTPFNPLLIYSNPGLGKTHLLQAIGNFTLSINSSMKIVYLPSEKFMHYFIRSIQNNKSTEFVAEYRNVDMLLLDDVQFFQNKEQTQEQFFHLFNDLYQQGKQIVLTSDQHPNELIGLKDRLLSRFQSGLTSLGCVRSRTILR